MLVGDFVEFLKTCHPMKKFIPRLVDEDDEPLEFVYAGAHFDDEDKTLYFHILHSEEGDRPFQMQVTDLLFISDSYPDDSKIKALLKLPPGVFPQPVIAKGFSFFQDSDCLYFDCSISF